MTPPGDPCIRPDRVEMEALMKDFAHSIGADGITLWKARDGHLVAVLNPLEPAIVGLRQPLDRGLISRVYLTGQAILEQALTGQPTHDPAIDRQLGTRGMAMMAASVEGGSEDDEGGVLSAVILEGNRREADFSLDSLARLSDLARELATRWEPL